MLTVADASGVWFDVFAAVLAFEGAGGAFFPAGWGVVVVALIGGENAVVAFDAAGSAFEP